MYTDDNGNIFTLAELKAEYEANADNIRESSNATSFEEWLSNCLSKNGTLSVIRGNGSNLYEVAIGTGLAWTQNYVVYANNEQDAVDTVADYVEDSGFEGLYADHYELLDCCEVGQTVDEYAEANNLTCCGSHGIYMQIQVVKGGVLNGNDGK